MKKYLLMIAAIVTMIATSVSLASCGDDDDDDYIDTFAIQATATQGTLSNDEYQELQEGLADCSKTCSNVSKSAAVAAFNHLVTNYNDYIQNLVNQMKVYNISVTMRIVNSKGDIVAQKTWSPK